MQFQEHPRRSRPESETSAAESPSTYGRVPAEVVEAALRKYRWIDRLWFGPYRLIRWVLLGILVGSATLLVRGAVRGITVGEFLGASAVMIAALALYFAGRACERELRVALEDKRRARAIGTARPPEADE